MIIPNIFWKFLPSTLLTTEDLEGLTSKLNRERLLFNSTVHFFSREELAARFNTAPTPLTL